MRKTITITTAAVAAAIFLAASPVGAGDVTTMKFSAGPNDTGGTLYVNLFTPNGTPISGGGWQRFNPASPPGLWEPEKYNSKKTDIWASTALLRGLPGQGGDVSVFGACKIGFGSQAEGSASSLALGVKTYPAPDGSAAKCYKLTGTGSGVSVSCSLTGGTGQGTKPPVGACK